MTTCLLKFFVRENCLLFWFLFGTVSHIGMSEGSVPCLESGI